ncbi:MAG: hypothetical protein WCU00_01860 [Candidatus Latescibacterota bacterium]
MKKMLIVPAVLALSAMILLGGCASAKFISTGTSAAAKADGCQIEIFDSKLPDHDYEELGVIEGDGFMGAATLEKVLPKMKIQACRAGGDAIILKTSQKFYNGLDDKFFITATVIRWKN